MRPIDRFLFATADRRDLGKVDRIRRTGLAGEFDAQLRRRHWKAVEQVLRTCAVCPDKDRAAISVPEVGLCHREPEQHMPADLKPGERAADQFRQPGAASNYNA